MTDQLNPVRKKPSGPNPTPRAQAQGFFSGLMARLQSGPDTNPKSYRKWEKSSALRIVALSQRGRLSERPKGWPLSEPERADYPKTRLSPFGADFSMRTIKILQQRDSSPGVSIRLDH